jgi:hypothetical protein
LNLIRIVGVLAVIVLVGIVGLLLYPLVFPCSAQERSVLKEFSHYGNVEPKVHHAAEIGGCAVFYDTKVSQRQVAEYYINQLNAHGWKAEKSVSESWEARGDSIKKPKKTFPQISIGAERGDFYYEVFFESHELNDPEEGTHVAVNLSKNTPPTRLRE